MLAIAQCASASTNVDEYLSFTPIQLKIPTLEVAGISDPSIASARALATVVERSASPVTTQAGVDDDRVVVEVLGGLAGVVVREHGGGLTPR